MYETKITIKVIPSLKERLAKKLDSCFIKRDAFIEHLITVETPRLATEMSGKRLSKRARKYISDELQRKGPKPLHIKISKDTAQSLNKIIKESNMVRDAFFNRLILLLTATEENLNYLFLPTDTGSALRNTNYGDDAQLPTSALNAIHEIVADPFWYFRAGVDDSEAQGIYLCDIGKPYPYLACYLDDKEVPGTDAYKEAQQDEDELFSLL